MSPDHTKSHSARIKTDGDHLRPRTSPQTVLEDTQPRRRQSPGPKTDAGKARVRLNAVKHGLCAATPAIPELERVDDWETHRTSVLDSLAPAGYLELMLAERAASLLWRLNRVAVYERKAIVKAHAQMKLMEWSAAERDRPPEPVLPDPRTLDAIMRYEAHVSRQLLHALHELEALQTRRRGRPAPLARLDVHGLREG